VDLVEVDPVVLAVDLVEVDPEVDDYLQEYLGLLLLTHLHFLLSIQNIA
jgi:hypothetical protein